MEYEINNQAGVKVNQKIFGQIINNFTRVIKLKDKKLQISVALVDNKTIKKLNKIYRGLDKVTDVLSFSHLEEKVGSRDIFWGQNKSLGEIIICYSEAKKQAQKRGYSVSQELKVLLAHGLLHLVGYDHENEKDRGEMFELQDKIVSECPGYSETIYYYAKLKKTN